MVSRILLTHLAYGGLFTLVFISVGILGRRINKKKWNYRAAYANYLMVFVLASVGLCFITGDQDVVMSKVISIIISVLIFNLILVLFIKKLRKRCYAKHVATLWVISNVMYIFLFGSMWDDMVVLPIVFIKVPAKAAAVIGIIWVMGIAVYMAVAVISHCRYRKEIRECSRQISWDSEELVNQVYKRIYENPDYTPFLNQAPDLRISKYVNNPISIGPFKNEIILPENEYTESELEWIFKHELVHIRNRDASLKLFLIFCNAMFWFFPPMWKAVSNASEDFELGCDEEVLENAGDSERRAYAELLLDTAGESRGFTTCLSADGQSMRYRLGEIVHPKEKSKSLGLILMTISAMVLLSTFHLVGFTYNYGTLEDKIFDGQVQESIKVIDSEIPESELYDLITNKEMTSIGHESIGFMDGDYDYANIKVGDMEYHIGRSGRIVEIIYFENVSLRSDFYYII